MPRDREVKGRGLFRTRRPVGGHASLCWDSCPGATGLVYVEGYQGAPHAFGWHMWTQALVDGVWVDLDATLPLAYDAAHLLTATTPLDGATMDRDISGLLQLMGDLDITIREEGS